MVIYKLMLIITGNGRSGTSVIASFLHKLNFNNAGGDDIDQTINGGAEAGWTKQHILRPFNLGEDLNIDIIKLINKFDIIKSPQFMNQGNEVFWSKFKQFDPNLKVLISYRSFKDTANSFKKYNMSEYGKGKETYTDDELISLEGRLKKYFFNCILFLNKLDIKYEIINFPNYLFNYTGVTKTLNNLGFDFDKIQGKIIWDQYIDKNKYTNKKGDIFMPSLL